jgi:hypothetical protein
MSERMTEERLDQLKEEIRKGLSAKYFGVALEMLIAEIRALRAELERAKEEAARWERHFFAKEGVIEEVCRDLKEVIAERDRWRALGEVIQSARQYMVTGSEDAKETLVRLLAEEALADAQAGQGGANGQERG